MEGFYTEGLLERPGPLPHGSDVGLPDDIRSLAAGGGTYREAATPVIDLDALIGELEAQR